MKILVTTILFFGQLVFAQSATVDVVLSPMGDFKAKTNDIKGFAVLSGNTVKAENILVNLNSLKTGVELRDKHTKKYLQTDKYPDAVLVSAVGNNGKGTGKIKIKGITKDISGVYKVANNKFEADFLLKLSDFDIKDINYMNVGVEDEIKIHIQLPIKK